MDLIWQCRELVDPCSAKKLTTLQLQNFLNSKMYYPQNLLTLNSPGLAFIARVLSTSKGCVKVVAIAPYFFRKKNKIYFQK